jgi:hypothetical protein
MPRYGVPVNRVTDPAGLFGHIDRLRGEIGVRSCVMQTLPETDPVRMLYVVEIGHPHRQVRLRTAGIRLGRYASPPCGCCSPQWRPPPSPPQATSTDDGDPR